MTDGDDITVQQHLELEPLRRELEGLRVRFGECVLERDRARAELESYRIAAASDPDMRKLAAQLVESELRNGDVCEIRLWSKPWRSGLAVRECTVTLTLQNHLTEIHSESLGSAIARLGVRHG